MADRQPGVPQHGEQAGNGFGMGLLGRDLAQHQHVDVRAREQFTAAVAANGKQGQAAVGRHALHPGIAQQLVHRTGTQCDQFFRVFGLAEAAVQAGVSLDQNRPCAGGPGSVTCRVDLPVGPRGDGVLGHRRGTSPAARVSTSTPVSVTATMCSHCAESLRSLVTTVQPSGSTLV